MTKSIEDFKWEIFNKEHPDPMAWMFRGQALEDLKDLETEFPIETASVRVYINALENALKVVNLASRGDVLAGSEYFDTPGEISGTLRCIRSWVHQSKSNWQAFLEERRKNREIDGRNV